MYSIMWRALGFDSIEDFKAAYFLNVHVICSNNLHVFVDSVVEDMCSVIIIIIIVFLFV